MILILQSDEEYILNFQVGYKRKKYCYINIFIYLDHVQRNVSYVTHSLSHHF